MNSINTKFTKLIAEVERATEKLHQITTHIYELMDAYDQEQVEQLQEKLEREGKIP